MKNLQSLFCFTEILYYYLQHGIIDKKIKFSYSKWLVQLFSSNCKEISCHFFDRYKYLPYFLKEHIIISLSVPELSHISEIQTFISQNKIETTQNLSNFIYNSFEVYYDKSPDHLKLTLIEKIKKCSSDDEIHQIVHDLCNFTAQDYEENKKHIFLINQICEWEIHPKLTELLYKKLIPIPTTISKLLFKKNISINKIISNSFLIKNKEKTKEIFPFYIKELFDQIKEENEIENIIMNNDIILLLNDITEFKKLLEQYLHFNISNIFHVNILMFLLVLRESKTSISSVVSELINIFEYFNFIKISNVLFFCFKQLLYSIDLFTSSQIFACSNIILKSSNFNFDLIFDENYCKLILFDNNNLKSDQNSSVQFSLLDIIEFLIKNKPENLLYNDKNEKTNKIQISIVLQRFIFLFCNSFVKNSFFLQRKRFFNLFISIFKKLNIYNVLWFNNDFLLNNYSFFDCYESILSNENNYFPPFKYWLSWELDLHKNDKILLNDEIMLRKYYDILFDHYFEAGNDQSQLLELCKQVYLVPDASISISLFSNQIIKFSNPKKLMGLDPLWFIDFIDNTTRLDYQYSWNTLAPYVHPQNYFPFYCNLEGKFVQNVFSKWKKIFCVLFSTFDENRITLFSSIITAMCSPKCWNCFFDNKSDTKGISFLKEGIQEFMRGSVNKVNQLYFEKCYSKLKLNSISCESGSKSSCFIKNHILAHFPDFRLEVGNYAIENPMDNFSVLSNFQIPEIAEKNNFSSLSDDLQMLFDAPVVMDIDLGSPLKPTYQKPTIAPKENSPKVLDAASAARKALAERQKHFMQQMKKESNETTGTATPPTKKIVKKKRPSKLSFK